MNVLTELHHSGLFASLHYLLEDRLGHNLYRPIGMDWFDRGYWRIAEPYGNDIATVKQFLEIDNIPSDGSGGLNNLKHLEQNGVHHIWDEAHEYYQKAITLQTFLDMDIDIIIATVPAHIHAYRKLIQASKKNTKLVYQIGNIGWHRDIPWDQVNNLMASVKPFEIPDGKNAVFYRQEFPLDVFSKATEPPKKEIRSFVNCLPRPELFNLLRGLLGDYSMYSHGITCQDGIITGTREIARLMKQSAFGYHVKPHGDGFGHVIHNWFAVGRPVIVDSRDYADKLAGDLLIDGTTCIDISDKPMRVVADMITGMTERTYLDMCDAVSNIFSRKVNFEKDAENVKEFIYSLY